MQTFITTSSNKKKYFRTLYSYCFDEYISNHIIMYNYLSFFQDLTNNERYIEDKEIKLLLKYIDQINLNSDDNLNKETKNLVMNNISILIFNLLIKYLFDIESPENEDLLLELFLFPNKINAIFI